MSQEYRLSRKINNIKQRQQYALLANEVSLISTIRDKALGIIASDGLESKDAKVRLDTAVKLLPYVLDKIKIKTTDESTKSTDTNDLSHLLKSGPVPALPENTQVDNSITASIARYDLSRDTDKAKVIIPLDKNQEKYYETE